MRGWEEFWPVGSLLMWASRGSQARWESGSEMEDSYTELERAVVILVENFYKYVSKHSLVKNKISKSSFRKMLQKELNHMLTVRPPHAGLVSPRPRSPRALRAASVLSELHTL